MLASVLGKFNQKGGRLRWKRRARLLRSPGQSLYTGHLMPRSDHGRDEASTQDIEAEQEFQILGYKHVIETRLRDRRN